MAQVQNPLAKPESAPFSPVENSCIILACCQDLETHFKSRVACTFSSLSFRDTIQQNPDLIFPYLVNTVLWSKPKPNINNVLFLLIQ